MAVPYPSSFGPFTVTSRIGRGGMGTVFRGVHRETGQSAAVKMLAAPLAEDENFRNRFEQEIEALRQLHHPNIVRLLGFGQEDGTFYYVMELAEGRSLEEELRSGRRFTWQETLEIGIQTASALHCAHAHGIIHRDLKPANLLLTHDGRVKLTDFGIAALFGSGTLTMAGSVVGTLNYMAPEQASAQPTTTRTDLFSLGAVLTALLTGTPPFMAKSLAELLHQHSSVSVLRPSQLGIDIPVEFDELIGKLLEKSPERRPKNAYFVLRILEAVRMELNVSSEHQGSISPEEIPQPVPLSTAVLQQKLRSLADGNSTGPVSGPASDSDAVQGSDAVPAVSFTEDHAQSSWFHDFERSAQDAFPPSGELSSPSSEAVPPNPAVPQMDLFRSVYPSASPNVGFSGVSVNSGVSDDSWAHKSPENIPHSLECPPGSEPSGNVHPSEEGTEIFCVSHPECGPQGLQESQKISEKNGAVPSRNFFLEEKEELSSPIRQESPWGGLLMVLILLGISCLGAALLIRWWMCPADADTLYSRIQTEFREEKGVLSESLKKETETFLYFYAKDPRKAEVEEIQNEIELRQLERDLLRRIHSRRFQAVSPIERDYFNAVQDPHTHPELMLQNLEDFVTFYSAVCKSLAENSPNASEQNAKNARFLELAKRQIVKIRKDFQNEQEERRTILRQEVVHIQQLLASEDPEELERGIALRDAVLRLYGDREPEIVNPLRKQ